MKKILFLLCFLATFTLVAQQNRSSNDIIVKNNGELIQANVIKVTSDAISFRYPGEQVVNEVSAGSLQKIVFASGRTQFFTTNDARSNSGPERPSTDYPIVQTPQTPENPASTETARGFSKEEIYVLPDYDENTLAVIPSIFEKNGLYNKALSSESTSYVTEYLSKFSSQTGIGVQDMQNTITKLVRAGISHENLSKTDLETLRKATGTQFIVWIELKENANNKKEKAVSAMDSFFSATQSNNEEALTNVEDDDVDTSISLKLHDGESKDIVYKVTLHQGVSIANELQISTWRSSMDLLLNQLMQFKNL